MGTTEDSKTKKFKFDSSPRLSAILLPARGDGNAHKFQFMEQKSTDRASKPAGAFIIPLYFSFSTLAISPVMKSNSSRECSME